MSAFKKFEEIIAWQEARSLNIVVGKLIDEAAFKKNYKLINQIEGSAGSIMDNIAEGFERSGNKEFVQFLYIAKGSCGELRSQMHRAMDRNYITQIQFENIGEHAKRTSFLLQKLINSIGDSPFKGIKYKEREN